MNGLQVALGSRISCYETAEMRKIIAYLYERESKQWHRGVHKRGGTMEENIESTLETIDKDSKMYVVKVGDELAAFFVRFEKNGFIVLEGFHVAKKFRNADFLPQFWKLVKEKLGSSFSTGICSKNEAAISHLLKQGFEVDCKKIIDDQMFFILSLKS